MLISLWSCKQNEGFQKVASMLAAADAAAVAAAVAAAAAVQVDLGDLGG